MCDGYIRAECGGTETVENSIAIFTEIINRVVEWDCDRVLYVEHYANQIPMNEMLKMLEYVFALVRQKGINGRIAIYDSNINDRTINLLSESLAGAHGINARVFLSEEQAIDWLKAC